MSSGSAPGQSLVPDTVSVLLLGVVIGELLMVIALALSGVAMSEFKALDDQFENMMYTTYYRCLDCGHEDREVLRVEYSSPVTGTDYDLQCLVCRSPNVEAT